jgi:hypothetical protein
MTKRLLSSDPVTGLMTWHDYDDQTDETIISYTADSTPVLELNKAMAKDDDFSRAGIKDGWWRYASIPVEVQMKWLCEEGIDVYNKHHGPRISAKLEDPAYRYLKATSGHHRLK